LNINDISLISSEEIEVHLKTFITSVSEQQRVRAYEFLKKYGDNGIVRKLKKIYSASDLDKKTLILKIFLGIDTNYSLKEFVELYFSSSPYDRKSMGSLMSGQGIFLFHFLVDYVKNHSKNSGISKEINNIIIGSGYFKNIQTLLKYPSSKVILYGLRQAYKYPVMEIIEFINPHLKSKDWQIRYNSLMVITRTNLDFAKEQIIKALMDPIEKIQIAAMEHIASSLSSYKEKIIEILSDDNKELKIKIFEILKSSGGVEFIPNLVPFVKKNDNEISILAMSTITIITDRTIKNNENFENSEEFFNISLAISELTKEIYSEEIVSEIRILLEIVGTISLIIILENYDDNIPLNKSHILKYIKGIDIFFGEEILLKMSEMDEKFFKIYLNLIVNIYNKDGIDIILSKIDKLDSEKLLIVGDNLLKQKIDRNSIKKTFNKFINSPDINIKKSAYEIISKCGGTEVIPIIKKDLESGEENLIKIAINSLTFINGKEPLKILKNLFLDKNFEKFEEIIMDSIILRKEFDVIILLLEFLSDEKIKKKDLLISKILERIKNSYINIENKNIINEIIDNFKEKIESIKPSEIKMLISLIQNGKKPGNPTLLENIKGIFPLLQSSWSFNTLLVGILLVAPNLIFTMDKSFIEKKNDLIEIVKTIIYKIDLMFISRLFFPDIFGDGHINSDVFINHFEKNSSGIISITYIILVNGDYPLKKEILNSLKMVKNESIFPIMKDIVVNSNEEELKDYAIEIIGNFKNKEIYDFLILISSDENNPLSEKAKLILEEVRGEELL